MMRGKLSKGVLIAIVTAGIILTFTTAGLLSINQVVPSSGSISITTVNVGVFSDSSCTHNLTSINWGIISPGDSVTRTIYVKNTGSTPITLSMNAINWNPSGADGPLTLTWNRESTPLTADQVTTARITLSVSESISGINGFSVDIVITGTG